MNITLGEFVAWDAVPFATDYDVNLHNAVGDLVTLSTGLETEISAETLFDGRPAGSYRVRVRSKNATLTSAYSAFLDLEYTGLAVPTNLRVE